jgi:peroxiredoxin
MTNQTCKLLIALIFLAAPALRGQATESSIAGQLRVLGAAPDGPRMEAPTVGPPDASARPKPIPDAERPATIIKIAKDIQTLPAGVSKVRLADALAHASFQGEAGNEALQATADTLAQAVTETPMPLAKDGNPARPYMDLAKFARYTGTKTSFNGPELAKASEILAVNDADVAKVDFTLKDVNGKKWTLSALKGKIVLVNFWSGMCPICQGKEMEDLDLIYTHFQSQGLVILSILSPTPENLFDVNHFLVQKSYHPPVPLDDGGKVAKLFHIDGVPRNFVFDRDGKLVGQSLDLCTQRQFFTMLSKAGLHP